MNIDVLDQKFDGLKNLINQKLDTITNTNDRIEKQVLSTNGRVRSLEKWRWGISGAIAILAFILTIFGGALLANIK